MTQLPDWIESVSTAIAMLISGGVIVRERGDRRQRDIREVEDRNAARRSYASGVAVWGDREAIQKAIGPEERRPVIVVHNAGDLPVYDAIVTVRGEGVAEPTCLEVGVLAPGTTKLDVPPDLYHELISMPDSWYRSYLSEEGVMVNKPCLPPRQEPLRFTASVKFRDVDGYRWMRGALGELVELSPDDE